MTKRYLNQDEILRRTNLKYYQLEYIIRTKSIPVYRFGKGSPRMYPMDTVKKINEIMETRQDGVIDG